MAASKLIEHANQNGGPDNITAILARWVDDSH
jgi:serine/threonine protein phosphatase PrpC